MTDEPTNAELLAYMQEQFARLSAQINGLQIAASNTGAARGPVGGSRDGQEPLRPFLMPADDEDDPDGGVGALIPA